MRRFRIELGVLPLLLLMASVGLAADHGAMISGVVRDSSGVPQMGAVVQILAADAAVRATAYTDLEGRYSVKSLLPGSYGVRASAALFLPALRSNLRLQPGHRSVVNLTLSALFSESAWLPARPRGKDELSDDWNWTLRSSAGRPILKLDDDGDPLRGAQAEGGGSRPLTLLRAEVTSPSGRFANGHARVSVKGDRVRRDGSNLWAKASLGTGAGGSPDGNISSDVSTSYERPLGMAGDVSGRVNYVSHPEIRVGSGASGLSVLSISSAERFGLGDFAEIEAGNRMQTVTGPGSLTVMRPFVRVDVHPGMSWLISYNLASAPDTQDYDETTTNDGDAPVVGYAGGRMQAATGLHQQIALSHKSKGTVVAVAYYADALDHTALSGGLANGAIVAQGMSSKDVFGDSSVMVDGSNGAFEALGQGYGASGMNVLLTQTLRRGAWVTLQYSTGAAIGRPGETPARTDLIAVSQLQARRGQSATISLRANIAATRTRARVSYRWQPGVLVTAIDPYDELAGGEYLSFHVRQPLSVSGLLPAGVELTVDGRNVLRQGYSNFEGRGDIPMYLAASPMSLQAGLAFTF